MALSIPGGDPGGIAVTDIAEQAIDDPLANYVLLIEFELEIERFCIGMAFGF